jgi:hypothetical protein
MLAEYVEYICVCDTTHDLKVETKHPPELKRFHAHGGHPVDVLGTIHRAIKTRDGVSDLRQASQTFQTYCPCHPLTAYYGHLPWPGTPYTAHFVGLDETDSCDNDAMAGMYTTVYVMLTRSDAPPIRTITTLFDELRPTQIQLSELLQKLSDHSGGRGADVLRGWLHTLLRNDMPLASGSAARNNNKRTILVTSAVIVAISTLYLISLSFG